MRQHEKQSWHPLIPLACTTNLLYSILHTEAGASRKSGDFLIPLLLHLLAGLAGFGALALSQSQKWLLLLLGYYCSCRDETVENTKKAGRCQNMKACCQFGRIVGRNGCLLVFFNSKGSKVIVCLREERKEKRRTYVNDWVLSNPSCATREYLPSLPVSRNATQPATTLYPTSDFEARHILWFYCQKKRSYI